MSDRTFWHIKGTANEFGDYQVMKEMSLDEILADLASPWKTRKLKHSGWWPQSWFICDQQDRVRMHYLLRQEELQDDLNRMLCELGYPMIRLDQINSSEPRLGHQAIQERPDLLEQIQALYQKDYELLGYAPATV